LKLVELPGSTACIPGAMEMKKLLVLVSRSELGIRTGIPIESLLSPNVYFTVIEPTPDATAVTCPDASTVATSVFADEKANVRRGGRTVCGAIRILNNHFQRNFLSWRVEFDSGERSGHAHRRIRSFHINLNRRRYWLVTEFRCAFDRQRMFSQLDILRYPH